MVPSVFLKEDYARLVASDAEQGPCKIHADAINPPEYRDVLRALSDEGSILVDRIEKWLS